MKTPHVITIGFAKRALERGSREYKRMSAYATQLGALSVVVYTLKEDGFSNFVENGNFTVYPTNTRTRLGALVRALGMLRTLAESDKGVPIIISAQDPFETGWLAWWVASRRHVGIHIQVHGDYFSRGWIGHSIVRRMRLIFAKILITRADAVRVASERIRTSLINAGIPASKIVVLPIRPELELFLTQTVALRPPRTFLYVGRLAPEKDVARIIKAFALVAEEIAHVRLRIVGSGPCEQALKKLTHLLQLNDKVDFVSWTNDVPHEMSCADVCVLASKHEAYGMVLLEAMAVGLPLVTTDVGCVGEVVKDGVHGLVVKGEGERLFADAMVRICSDQQLWSECAKNAKATARGMNERYTMHAYYDAWIKEITRAHDSM